MEERNSLKHTRAASCKQELPSGETIYPKSHLQRVYQKLIHMWEEEHPLQLPLAFHMGKDEPQVQSLQPGREGAPRSKVKLESRNTRLTFLPLLTHSLTPHHITKRPITLALVSQNVMFAFKP